MTYEQNELKPNPSDPSNGITGEAHPPDYRKFGAVPASELGEIVELEEAERRKRRRWGRWRFNLRNLTLQLARSGFEIDLEEIRTCADLVAWISYVSEKPYVDREDMGWFVRALDDIFGMENFTGWSLIWGSIPLKGKKVDPARVIRERFA